MNKRISSHPILLTNPRSRKNIKKKQSQQLQLIQSRQELDDLKSKVNQSRPILLSIYQKVKQKQKNYQQKLEQNNEKCKKIHSISRQYKTAFEGAIQIINKNKIIDKFQGLNNYRSASACHLNTSIEGEKGIEEKCLEKYQSLVNFQQGKKEQKGKIASIISQYKQGKKDDNKKMPFFNGSVYERYRNKIDGKQGKDESKQNKESMLNKVRRLSQQIDKDIKELRISKDKNLKELTKKQKKTQQLQRSSKKNKVTKGKKQYFALIQSRKLKLI